MTQHELAAAFRRLHTPTTDSPLVLPNAWDAMSARLVETAGARAIATTSAGVSWALGYPDGQGLTREAMLDAVRRIVRAVRIPVSADMESGYGTGSPHDIAETVRGIVDAGAVGLNLEDSPGPAGAPLRDTADQAARIAAARSTARTLGVDVFINARIDTFLKKVGDDQSRVEATIARAKAYVAAGADGVFVPLVSDPETIARLVADVGAPLNVIGGPGTPDISALRALGVSRVSVGPGLARAVMSAIRRSATELLHAGTYASLTEQIPSPEANQLFAER